VEVESFAMVDLKRDAFVGMEKSVGFALIEGKHETFLLSGTVVKIVLA
jgi:hypothetical protein